MFSVNTNKSRWFPAKILFFSFLLLIPGQKDAADATAPPPPRVLACGDKNAEAVLLSPSHSSSRSLSFSPALAQKADEYLTLDSLGRRRIPQIAGIRSRDKTQNHVQQIRLVALFVTVGRSLAGMA